jgi:hypothetical protein
MIVIARIISIKIMKNVIIVLEPIARITYIGTIGA